MMRILEHGGQVKMVKTSFVTQSVDTPEDLINVENSIKSSVV
jgi:CMP-2-keto-3-deoxyoctulosonic acid synthetase